MVDQQGLTGKTALAVLLIVLQGCVGMQVRTRNRLPRNANADTARLLVRVDALNELRVGYRRHTLEAVITVTNRSEFPIVISPDNFILVDRDGSEVTPASDIAELQRRIRLRERVLVVVLLPVLVPFGDIYFLYASGYRLVKGEWPDQRAEEAAMKAPGFPWNDRLKEGRLVGSGATAQVRLFFPPCIDFGKISALRVRSPVGGTTLEIPLSERSLLAPQQQRSPHCCAGLRQEAGKGSRQ